VPSEPTSKKPDDAAPGEAEARPETSGSIDVDVNTTGPTQLSSIALGRARENSGSIDINISAPNLATLKSDGAPTPVHAGDDSAPMSSGRVVAVPAGDPASTSKGVASAAADVIGEGVSKLGSGIETIGEGVTKLGDMTKKVPLVGSSVHAIGEGVTSVGEVLHDLPQIARTRRGRILVRSMIVGFLLVAGWIAVIVALQLHGNDSPDFRPDAEKIMVTLSHGREGIEKVYDQSSPRFQEMVRKERFVDDMTDMQQTLGRFREITAINDTLFTTGPTGKIGRVSITAAFDKATCRAAVNFHYDQGSWKLLGIQIELPIELKISQAQREERVQACKDTSSAKTCEVRAVAEHILEQLRDARAGEVYDAADDVFKKQEDHANFVKIQLEQNSELGAYKRIVAVTEAKVIAGTSATFDVLVEYEKTSAVRNVFGLSRKSKTEPWKLRVYKVVMPTPRAAEDVKPAVDKPPATTAPPDKTPRDAGPSR
jgi:hypothetical protein